MRSALRESLGPIQQDLSDSIGLALTVHDEQWNEVPGIDSGYLVSSTGAMTGIYVNEADDEEQRTVDLAEMVQDFVHEELSVLGRSAVWPVCPEHPHNHPMLPDLIAGRASWTCPVFGNQIRPIGPNIR